jgi:ubiA prenyltransferase
MIKNILKLIRVKQWIKNAFVLAPLLFSLKFTEMGSVVQSALAFEAFCFIASAVYVMNDILDRKKDALHPKKKNRPIASGKIQPVTGGGIACLLIVAVAVCLFILGSAKTAMTIMIYVMLNILYSYKLKQMVLVDVLVIAVGFILRVYAGAYAIGVPVSSFIFMTTLFLSLFLGFTKRKAELIRSGSEGREVLEKYSKEMVNQYIVISVALTIMCYALYTLEPSTIARFSTNRLIYSVIFVIYGMFRYIYILDKDENVEDPTESLYRDKGLMGACILYVLYVLAIFAEIV